MPEIFNYSLINLQAVILGLKTCIFCFMFVLFMLCGDYWGPTMELLSPMAVMSEGLGFNLCVVPFLNVCVLKLSQKVRAEDVGGGWRCHTRVGWEETKVGS